jgi:hypothetical protein
MHQDDLKAIWICRECKMIFVFHSDVVDHMDSTVHSLIEKRAMISLAETFTHS